MAGALQKTGVEAVVEGLDSFKSGIDQMNGKIGEIGSKGNILTRALGGAWEMLEKFGESAVRVAEFALGALLADAIEFIIGKLHELVSETIDAGAQFQILQLRLERLNFNTAIESGMEYRDAMGFATEATKEQMTWLQKLAVTTPYDAQDIANVFTLARSYGFTSTAAQGLTQDITNFAAGMGLGNTEIERIIVNFGQMVQQGKVTQREMNDLARGAFVPVNDILKRMQENVGMTGKKFDDFRNSGEGVNAFMTAFSQIVSERFTGAAENMARTFKGASDNAKDFVKSLIGFGVVTPVLDVVGGKIADMIAALTSPENWDALTKAVGFFGTALSYVLEAVLGGENVDMNGLVKKIIDGFNHLSTWVLQHKKDIVAFFQDAKDKALELFSALKNRDFEGFLKALGLDDELIGKITKIKDDVLKAFDTIKGWVDENGPLIKEFFGTLGEIVGGVFKNLAPEGGEGGLEGFLGGVKNFMDYVIENQEGITTFVTNLVKLWGILQLIGFVLALILPPIIAVLGFIISLAAGIAFLSAAWSALVAIAGVVIAIIGAITVPIFALIVVLGLLVAAVITNWDAIVAAFEFLKGYVVKWFTELKSNFLIGADALGKTFIQMWDDLVKIGNDQIDRMKKLGSAIIDGIAKGIASAAKSVIDAVTDVVQDAYNAAMDAIGANSPSKLYMNIGKFSMLGMAKGIEQYAGIAQAAMVDAMAGVALPAMNMSVGAAALGAQVNNTNSTVNNFGLTVNSSARTESLIQDYGMLQALVQG